MVDEPGSGTPMTRLISASCLSTIVLGSDRSLTSFYLTPAPICPIWARGTGREDREVPIIEGLDSPTLHSKTRRLGRRGISLRGAHRQGPRVVAQISADRAGGGDPRDTPDPFEPSSTRLVHKALTVRVQRLEVTECGPRPYGDGESRRALYTYPRLVIADQARRYDDTVFLDEAT